MTAAIQALIDANSLLLSINYDLRKERDRLLDEVEHLKKALDDASPMTRCDRCGGMFRLHTMVPEEGDEWECLACWERCNEVDARQARESLEVHK